jgi:hypothetical protein
VHVPPLQAITTSDEGLHSLLSQWGVPLLAAPAPDGLRGRAGRIPTELVRGLVTTSDARLRAALTCLLALHSDGAGATVLKAAAEADAQRRRLGALYRVARALVLSRAPELRRILGRTPQLGPLAIEPDDLAAPEELLGEATLSDVRDGAAEHLGIDGGTERVFDTWLRQRALECRS